VNNSIFKVGRGQRKERRPEEGQEAEDPVWNPIIKVGRGQRKEKSPRIQLGIPSFRKIEARGRRIVEKPDSDSSK
jgi:hypothetical protein